MSVSLDFLFVFDHDPYARGLVVLGPSRAGLKVAQILVAICRDEELIEYFDLSFNFVADLSSEQSIF